MTRFDPAANFDQLVAEAAQPGYVDTAAEVVIIEWGKAGQPAQAPIRTGATEAGRFDPA